MAFPTYTYSGDFTTQRDRVRVEIGDTTLSPSLKFQLADEEIAYAGTLEGNDVSAAARCCEFLEARYAQKADMTEGKLSIRLSQRSKAYHLKAKYLRAYAAMTTSLPSIGGESVSDKMAADQDTDRVPPAFWRDMLDNPETSALTPTSEGASDPFDQTN